MEEDFRKSSVHFFVSEVMDMRKTRQIFHASHAICFADFRMPHALGFHCFCCMATAHVIMLFIHFYLKDRADLVFGSNGTLGSLPKTVRGGHQRT